LRKNFRFLGQKIGCLTLIVYLSESFFGLFEVVLVSLMTKQFKMNDFVGNSLQSK